jgi:hypothetical protein
MRFSDDEKEEIVEEKMLRELTRAFADLLVGSVSGKSPLF